MWRELVLTGALFTLTPREASAQPSSEPPRAATGATTKAPDLEPPAHDPAFAITFAPEVGVAVLPGAEALDRELVEAGRPELGTLSGGAVGARFGVQVYGAYVSASIGAVFTEPGNAQHEANDSGLQRDWLLGELSYDVFPQSWLTLSPVVGAGVHVSRVCVRGAADEPPEGELFQQVLRDPGSGACLEQQQGVAKLGFVGGVALPLPVDDGVAIVTTFDLRPSITWALGDGTYEVLEHESLPPFEGPGSSRTSFSIVLDVGFVFGFGQR